MNIHRILSIFSASIILLFAGTSCGQSASGGFTGSSSLLSTEELTVHIPPLPESASLYAGLIKGMKLIWYDDQSQICSKILPAGSTYLICVCKNVVTPVLVWPVYSDQDFFLPAGAVYPEQASEGIVNLSWNNGTCAQVLYTLLQDNTQTLEEKRHFCSYFNWGKLQTEIEKKRERRFFQIHRIAEAIASGSMSTSALKEKKSVKVELSGSAVLWLASCDCTVPPIFPGTTFVLAEEGEVFLSDKGLVFVEKKKGTENTLVITELAR